MTCAPNTIETLAANVRIGDTIETEDSFTCTYARVTSIGESFDIHGNPLIYLETVEVAAFSGAEGYREVSPGLGCFDFRSDDAVMIVAEHRRSRA